MRTIEATQAAPGLRVAIVVSKYNDFVTERLQAGAVAALAHAGVTGGDITVIKVPGSFEVALAAQQAAAGPANKGWEAALAAVEMATVTRQLKQP